MSTLRSEGKPIQRAVLNMAEAVERARLRCGGTGREQELRPGREKSPSGELVGGDSLSKYVHTL